MYSHGNFSQLFTQLSQAFSSEGYKTHSLELLDPNHMSQDEFIRQIQSLSQEIPFLDTIIKYKNLFTLLPDSYMDYLMSYFSTKSQEEIGVGGNAKVFVNKFQSQASAVKTMDKINLSMLGSYVQECINQYNLIQINKEYILNFKGQIYINIYCNQAFIYIPLQLAEYSLYEYIQNNEITQEIYQYFYNFLIDLLVILHSNNYAHRDIKPQNILFIKGEGWKLADFGESVKYEQTEGLYKIQGTQAFLPQEIRKQINKNKEIHQNLYKNDIYAVICTLVMIKNPQFKSKDLINYMDTQILDLDLQQLLYSQNYDHSLQQLLLLKGFYCELNLEIFMCSQKEFDVDFDCTVSQLLQFRFHRSKPLDEKDLNLIDDLLRQLWQDQQFDGHKKLQLYVTLLFPFQLNQLKNFNQQLLNHKYIMKKKRFFLNDDDFKHNYLSTYMNYYTYVFNAMQNEVNQQNKYIILKLLEERLISGHIQEAQELLQFLGKIMLNQSYMDSHLLVVYDVFYHLLHGKSLSFDENYIQDTQLYQILQKKLYSEKYKYALDLNSYLDQNKIVVNNNVDLIQLFIPLYKVDVGCQTLSTIFRHIIQCLGFSELTIKEDQFKLVNYIKELLIKSGFRFYKQFIYHIIVGFEKLFINYDLFEGLLDLLHYFLNFIRFIDKLIYHYIVSAIQRLIFKLNISVYHIKDCLDIKLIKININLTQKQIIKYFEIFILRDLNIIQFNIIQDQQKTEQQQLNLDQNFFQLLLNEIIQKKYGFIYENKLILLSLKLYAQFLGYIENQKQNYLSTLVILSKCLYRDGQQSFNKNTEIIKSQLDPILLVYYIFCKQYNRITELFHQQKRKEDLKPFEEQIVEHLAETFLIRQNDMNRVISKYKFFYLEQLSRFALNQKHRQLFDFKQHLFVATTFRSMQKRLNVRDICLKEQYLRK